MAMECQTGSKVWRRKLHRRSDELGKHVELVREADSHHSTRQLPPKTSSGEGTYAAPARVGVNMRQRHVSVLLTQLTSPSLAARWRWGNGGRATNVSPHGTNQ